MHSGNCYITIITRKKNTEVSSPSFNSELEISEISAMIRTSEMAKWLQIKLPLLIDDVQLKLNLVVAQSITQCEYDAVQ